MVIFTVQAKDRKTVSSIVPPSSGIEEKRKGLEIVWFVKDCRNADFVNDYLKNHLHIREYEKQEIVPTTVKEYTYKTGRPLYEGSSVLANIRILIEYSYAYHSYGYTVDGIIPTHHRIYFSTTWGAETEEQAEEWAIELADRINVD